MKIGDRVKVAEPDRYANHVCSCIGTIIDIFANVNADVEWDCGFNQARYWRIALLVKVNGIEKAIARLK